MQVFYKILDWDSDFFQFPVCHIKHLPQDIKDIRTFLSRAIKEDIQLAYFMSDKEVFFPKEIHSYFDINQVNSKIGYSKNLNRYSFINKNIRPYSQVTPSDKLLKLAIESGIYSRFKTDKRIGKQKFEELYAHWISNSVNKQIAKEVLVYCDQKDILGLVTLTEKNNRGDIGLIAVDAKYRGRGIGKSLLIAAEQWCIKQGHTRIQVVTQIDNRPACALYEGNGYEVQTREYVYHLWKA